MNNYEPLFETLKKKDMSLRSLSSAIGFNPNSLGARVHEKGNLSSEALGKICRVLECKPEDVFEVVPEGTVIEHKRVCIQSKRVWENAVTVNWEKLEAFIKENGYNNGSLSKALGKNINFIANKKKAKRNTIDFLKSITNFFNADYQDFVL